MCYLIDFQLDSAFLFVIKPTTGMTHNALFFATLKRRARRGAWEGSCFF